ncbi:MAG TPA: hypothetical protein VN035_11795 [Microbacterium sp.]|nr:hypothetical protein [Microbacterium sp.]
MPRHTKSDYENAFRTTWARGQGTPLIPSDLDLHSTRIRGDALEIQLRTSGEACFAVRLPFPTSGDPTSLPGVESDRADPEQWALWQGVVPIVEQIQTDALGRITADDQGLRWLSLS